MWVRPLLDADASCGGKAMGLARLVAAKLPVPEGFVIDDRAFHAIAAVGAPPRADGPRRFDDELLGLLGHDLERAAERVRAAPIPDELLRDVDARAAALGAPFAVRSSATIEDGDVGAAAGVFSSREAVDLASLWWAIRTVWESALTPLAAAYARGRALSTGVIVQRFVAGTPLRVSTRPPGSPDRSCVWIQEAGALVERGRDDRDPVVVLALAAEAAIGATRGADVELVRAGDATWLVQARPVVHPVAIVRVSPPPIVIAPLLADGRTWTWDASHNPDPLSIAQADLVELVDRAGIAPWDMHVAGGYLYTTPRTDTRRAGTVDVGELEAAMAEALDDDSPVIPSVEDAIERYLAFYRLWAEMSSIVTRLGGPRRSIVHAILSRGLPETEVISRLGVLSPAWDVAVPTYAERPHLLRDAIARAKVLVPSDPGPEDLGERDDLWFARAQLVVRRALLARAAERGLPDDDIFWLPLEDLAIDRDDARRRASAARNVAALASRWQMPIVVNGPPGVARKPLHGLGIGPRVTGRVVRIDMRDPPAVGRGDVVVCSAVTPALAVVVIGCSAIVCETGGLLDHGAALARELGITCVVDCHDAWSRLVDGMIVIVDGDHGSVEIAS